MNENPQSSRRIQCELEDMPMLSNGGSPEEVHQGSRGKYPGGAEDACSVPSGGESEGGGVLHRSDPAEGVPGELHGYLG